jgi:uncharacterized protein (TIGR02611 family)
MKMPEFRPATPKATRLDLAQPGRDLSEGMKAGWKERGNLTLQTARKIAIGVVGFTVVGIGVALLVLPGPGLLVIPLGLAVLATEFVWAKRWLQRVRNLISSGKKSATESSAASQTGGSRSYAFRGVSGRPYASAGGRLRIFSVHNLD